MEGDFIEHEREALVRESVGESDDDSRGKATRLFLCPTAALGG